MAKIAGSESGSISHSKEWIRGSGSGSTPPNVMDPQHRVKNLPSMKEPEGRLARNGQVRSP
jgi:hypothetical protein